LLFATQNPQKRQEGQEIDYSYFLLYYITQYTYESLLPKVQLIQTGFGLCSWDPLPEKPDMPEGAQ
jgi:hypothetical protein